MKAYTPITRAEDLKVGKSFITGESGVIFTCKSIASIDGHIQYNLELSNMLNDVKHTTTRFYKKENVDRMFKTINCSLVK